MRERGRIHALASEYVRCEYVSEKNEEKEHVKRNHFFKFSFRPEALRIKLTGEAQI